MPGRFVKHAMLLSVSGDSHRLVFFTSRTGATTTESSSHLKIVKVV